MHKPVDSRIYWIWLQRAIPLGSRDAGRILQNGLRPETLYAAAGPELETMGFAGRSLDGLCLKSLEEAEGILQALLGAGDYLLTPDDAYYPALLRPLTGGPLALYCRGELPNLEITPAFGIVGTRHPTESGRQNAASLAAGLAAAGLVVVSGGAVGIDGAAHLGAVRAGGRTVLIKAGPLDSSYPVENAGLREEILSSGGLILSEYPPGSREPCNFHVRNRLISGLSLGVCLVETPKRSGALITAACAREQGRDVFAMPGDVPAHRNDGAHRLIQEGAGLVTRAEDILIEYEARWPGLLDFEAAGKAQEAMAVFLGGKVRAARRPEPPKPSPPRRTERRPEPPAAGEKPVPLPEGASAQASQVYACLGLAPVSADEIAGKTGLPAGTVLAALTELELLGCARSGAGQSYRLNTAD